MACTTPLPRQMVAAIKTRQVRVTATSTGGFRSPDTRWQVGPVQVWSRKRVKRGPWSMAVCQCWLLLPGRPSQSEMLIAAGAPPGRLAPEPCVPSRYGLLPPVAVRPSWPTTVRSSRPAPLLGSSVSRHLKIFDLLVLILEGLFPRILGRSFFSPFCAHQVSPPLSSGCWGRPGLCGSGLRPSVPDTHYSPVRSSLLCLCCVSRQFWKPSALAPLCPRPSSRGGCWALPALSLLLSN